MLVVCSSRPGQVGGGSCAENPELWAKQQKRGGAIFCRVKGAVGRVRPELNELLVETVSDLSRGEGGVW
jgi:hypothetical protein